MVIGAASIFTPTSVGLIFPISSEVAKTGTGILLYVLRALRPEAGARRRAARMLDVNREIGRSFCYSEI
jgi:hypothetical protein